ncbi:MAG TPA: trypsin-like peptidase domain-containing protein, partial [Candidatus Coproplasma avicola]|nr:trypsin-like peptidase domain-containing protein [Candidatus Coproplasma avicola]
VDIDKDEGDMYIVTNCHVVFNNSSLNDNKYSDDVDVYLYGREYSTYSSVVNGELQYYIDDTYAIPAQIIGASLNYDIAVLKVDNSDAVKNSSAIAADWSGNESVPVGETVYAIGNAAGSGISATNGIVCVDSEYITLDMYDTTSNYNDDFTYRTIRTSVPIYSGNSGGGLFNIDGDLVGIINSKTTAASSGEYSDNISHALPEANVRRVVQSMIDRYEQTGSTTYGIYRALLGITVEASSPSADMNNDTNTVEKIDNAEITDIQSGSLAEGSLNVGDVITAIKITSSDGTVKEDVEVKRSYNLSEVMLSARSGDCVCITVNRSGQENPISYTFIISDANLSLVG